MTDQAQVIAVADRLIVDRAFRGAAQVLFNAALIAEREAAEVRDRQQWTPDGPIPRRRKPEPHADAANDHLPILSEQPAPPVA